MDKLNEASKLISSAVAELNDFKNNGEDDEV